MSLSFSVILVETPINISMLSHSVTPIAYKSLKTLAAAILPIFQILACFAGKQIYKTFF